MLNHFKTLTNRAFRSGVILFSLLAFLMPLLLPAQGVVFDPYKVKDVSKSDFSLENDVIDENAKAVYLFDLGESKIAFSSSDVQLEFTRNFRLEILSEQGLELADQMVELYMTNNIEEKIGRLKGGVYNLENGKIQFEKLQNSDWFIETYDEHTKIVRFTFKNVKVGSIIELRYTLFSPFVFRMPDWVFQYDNIPVLYSEYFIRYPEELGYKIFKSGSQPLIGDYHTVETKVRTEKGVSTGDFRQEIYGMACENVPGLREEPIMDSPENYRSRVITELNYTDFPDHARDYYYKDWPGGIHDYMEEGFNNRYMNPKDRYGYFTLDTVKCSDRSDSVRSIYDHIRSAFTNSEAVNYLSPKRSPREVIVSGKATPSEINWVLISTLRANGIETYPVLVSTRAGQRIRKDYPIFSQFSSCLAAVKTGHSYFLLDASSPVYNPGDISEFYYNGDGLVVNEADPVWIPIKSVAPANEICSIELTNLEGNVLSGKMSLSLSGLYRNRIGNALRQINKSDLTGLLHLVKNAEIKFNEEESNLNASPMELNFDIKLSLEKFGNSYLLPAVIYDDMSNNILKEQKRRYPVDFADKWAETYTCLVHLDKDKYSVTLPESTSLSLPNQDAKFMFSAAYNFGTLVVRNKIEMNKVSFSPIEYPTLRQFYDLISTTHSSFIEITEN